MTKLLYEFSERMHFKCLGSRCRVDEEIESSDK